jgi:shikimate kinase
MRNLVLIGFMGSGKSTIGRIVSGELKMKLVDLDRWIEERKKMPIAEIFEKEGEDAFRELETEAVKEVSKSAGQVIATGGGVVLRKSNLEILAGSGILIHLQVDAATVLARTQRHSHRPLLQGPDATLRIEKLMKERQSFYDAIPNSVQSAKRPISDVVADVLRIYRKSVTGSSPAP